MYDATVDAQLNTLRWRNNEVINAMPRDPLNYKQPVAAALDRVVGVTSRRNGDVPDWVRCGVPSDRDHESTAETSDGISHQRSGCGCPGRRIENVCADWNQGFEYWEEH